MSTIWYCCRQRAGPLVKECRALRPRLDHADTATDRKEKEQLKRLQHGTFERRQVDRLELRIALTGWRGSMHTLTFDEEHLPQTFAGVRLALQAFFRRSQRWRAGLGKSPQFDYLYAIEGLHGERRYHVHLITDNDQLTPAEVAHLWRCGIVDNEPVLKKRLLYDPKTQKPIIDPVTGKQAFDYPQGYRQLAEYLNKERTDGHVIPIGRHPWSCSRSLLAKLPEPERWKDTDGGIIVPQDAVYVRRGAYENDFGTYHYASWIEHPSRATDMNRACARAINLEI